MPNFALRARVFKPLEGLPSLSYSSLLSRKTECLLAHNRSVDLALNLTGQSVSRDPRSRWKSSPCFRVPGFCVRSGGWGRTHRPLYIHVIESKQTSFRLWPSPWLVQPAHSGIHSSLSQMPSPSLHQKFKCVYNGSLQLSKTEPYSACG